MRSNPLKSPELNSPKRKGRMSLKKRTPTFIWANRTPKMQWTLKKSKVVKVEGTNITIDTKDIRNINEFNVRNTENISVNVSKTQPTFIIQPSQTGINPQTQLRIIEVPKEQMKHRILELDLEATKQKGSKSRIESNIIQTNNHYLSTIFIWAA